MNLADLLSLLNAVLCLGLGLVALWARSRTLSNWLFFFGMAIYAAESLLWGASLHADGPGARLRFQEWRVLAASCLPFCWVGFSLSYSRGNAAEFLRRWAVLLAAAALLPIGLGISFLSAPLLSWGEKPEEAFFAVLRLGGAAKVANLADLVASILVLMNLERTFRSSVGTMRWRIKYLVVGLVVLFGGRIYLSTQFLLYSAVDLRMEMVGAITCFTACLLIGFSLARARFVNLDVYPSHAVLRHSLTGMIAGGYLLVVGVLAKLVSALGAAGWFPLVTLSIVVGGVGVGLLFLSDRVRQRIKRVVSRHFRRPFHDYRIVWASFTERTTMLVSEGDFGREVAKLVAETFEVLSASLWLVDDDSREFRCVASTAAETGADANATGRVPAPDEVIAALRRESYPLLLNPGGGPAVETLKQLVPEHFRKGGGRVCVPLVSGAELMGTLMLGDRVSGVSFSVDDLDLLKCIGDHVAARLRNLRLSDQLLQAREMEAFQTMSAFFVHDLKNTASTLSLMLQNMARHFDDPSFREDAMRGLGRSVEHINQLVAELTVLRQKLEPRLQDLDLDELVSELAARLDWAAGVRLQMNPGPAGRVPADPAMLQKILTNLVINAREAIGSSGEVRIRTGRRADWVFVEVEDTGPGMDPEFLRHSLFKPFRTTKKKGLGIGLFHCKMMVEAHHGRIEVESQPGKGTLVRVLLPHRAPTR